MITGDADVDHDQVGMQEGSRWAQQHLQTAALALGKKQGSLRGEAVSEVDRQCMGLVATPVVLALRRLRQEVYHGQPELHS